MFAWFANLYKGWKEWLNEPLISLVSDFSPDIESEPQPEVLIVSSADQKTVREASAGTITQDGVFTAPEAKDTAQDVTAGYSTVTDNNNVSARTASMVAITETVALYQQQTRILRADAPKPMVERRRNSGYFSGREVIPPKQLAVITTNDKDAVLNMQLVRPAPDRDNDGWYCTESPKVHDHIRVTNCGHSSTHSAPVIDSDEDDHLNNCASTFVD